MFEYIISVFIYLRATQPFLMPFAMPFACVGAELLTSSGAPAARMLCRRLSEWLGEEACERLAKGCAEVFAKDYI